MSNPVCLPWPYQGHTCYGSQVIQQTRYAINGGLVKFKLVDHVCFVAYFVSLLFSFGDTFFYCYLYCNLIITAWHRGRTCRTSVVTVESGGWSRLHTYIAI